MSQASKPFVERVRIQNFGCVQDTTIELTRLHALIGPNDSGKSTVLAALRTVGELVQHGESNLSRGGLLDPRGVPDSSITMRWGADEVACRRRQTRWEMTTKGRAPGADLIHSLQDPVIDRFLPLRGARIVRWDPDAIRTPAELIPETSPLLVGERGEGLAAVYDAILSLDRAAFDNIEASLRRHSSTIKSIWLPTLDRSTKSLGVVLNDGTKVHAKQMSEGLLYWLAFASLPYVDSTAILLVEEPENGLHPSRITEVMQVLRTVSNSMQVILATHSPLVINELQPDEVTILTRNPETGTRATRMDRTTHFQQRQKVYALGELWLSFADGDAETALVPDGTTTPAG